MAFLHYPFLAILLFCISTAGSTDSVGNYCDDVHKSNNLASIRNVLSKLVSLSAQDGFGTTSYGVARKRIYGMYQCRGDVNSKDCSTCLKEAAREILKLCPDRVDAKIWYDFCFLRYKVDNFIGEVDKSPGIIYGNNEFLSDPDSFNKKLAKLKNEIVAEAIVPKNKGLGKGKSELSTFITLYALAQCTRDLSAIDCAHCLAVASDHIPTNCNDRKGCRLLYGSCYIRYELYPFFFPLYPKEKLANESINNYFKVSKP